MVFRVALLCFIYCVLQVSYEVLVVEPVPLTVHESFYKEVRNFNKFASYQNLGPKEKERMKTLSIRFGPVKNLSPFQLSGICFHEHNEIWIEESHWEKLDSNWRQHLIDHEIGHCVLGRTHRHAKNEHGQPESIMTPFYTAPPKYDSFGNTNNRHELFDSKLFDKLPELLSSMKSFEQTNKDLIPFMMATPYDIALAFEDVLNYDAPKESQNQRLKAITSQAKEIENSWKQSLASVEQSGNSHLSIFEREQRAVESFLKKIKENQGL